MTSVAAGHLDALDTLLSEKDEKTAVELLQTVKGIGPTVAKTVWLLLQ
jgi:3-methyladenine DNA glycosylase/8-oxoguanine DNA glycosylase